MDYIPHSQKTIDDMLETIGVSSVEDLYKDIPLSLRSVSYSLPKSLSQLELTEEITQIALKNKSLAEYDAYIGAGFYHHFIPSVVDSLSSRSEFYTAYTPYQPEVSQGTLQVIFEFQSLLCRLTGMDVSNASLYDGASATAEAVLMSMSHSKKNKIIVSPSIHPEYRNVLTTYLQGLSANLITPPLDDGTIDLDFFNDLLDTETAAVLIQQPNFFGCLEDVDTIQKIVKKTNTLLVVICNPISLGILEAPGQYGADIVVGEGQPLGNHLNFGGPGLGFMACKKELARKMPGRIVGLTTDSQGKRGYVLTLQTREQHIRREKATSNICTNEALNALIATIYLSHIGSRGLKDLALLNLKKAHEAQQKICSIPGFSLQFDKPFFNEFVIKSSHSPLQINEELLKEKIIGGLPLKQWYDNLDNGSLYCVTETATDTKIDRLITCLQSIHEKR
ncbi:aminomethyl-transferring glycine dehydrogenase subunit GcvPA [Chlamydiota bacterium]